MLFTCEQVSGGHPDKICDQISDAIVTDCLKHDRNSRVAVECMIKGYEVNIAGEITSKHDPDCRALARHVLFNYCAYEDLPRYNITVNLTRQSPDIAQGVDSDGDKKLGAGDQGMMFGYATSETREMLPLPYVLACEALERLRDCGAPCLRPDAKCQVTFDYGKHRIDTFLISTQHAEDASTEAMLTFMNQEYPLTSWSAFQPDRPESDFRDLPAADVLMRVTHQIDALTDICTKCMNDPEHAAEYRLEAFESCPGLTELWPQPFQAKYDAADGAVLVRFKTDRNGTLQMTINTVEK